MSDVKENQDQTIILAGKPYPLCDMAIKQNRLLFPMLIKAVDLKIKSLTTEDMDFLANMIFIAINADREITQAEFDNMKITPLELARSVLGITQACGFKGGTIEAGEEKPSGEEAALSQTGTA